MALHFLLFFQNRLHGPHTPETRRGKRDSSIVQQHLQKFYTSFWHPAEVQCPLIWCQFIQMTRKRPFQTKSRKREDFSIIFAIPGRYLHALWQNTPMLLQASLPHLLHPAVVPRAARDVNRVGRVVVLAAVLWSLRRTC